MKTYTANVEKNDRNRDIRMVSTDAFNAQEAHKKILCEIGNDERIISLFRKRDGRCVFKSKRGFFE
jgi:Lon protease-like protein